MAVSHYTLTLSGSAQALSSISNAPTNAIRTVTIQADPANANPVYVGASGVTSSDYGIYIPTPASASLPYPPLILGETQSIHGHFKLSDIYVLGTNTQKIHLIVVTL